MPDRTSFAPGHIFEVLLNNVSIKHLLIGCQNFSVKLGILVNFSVQCGSLRNSLRCMEVKCLWKATAQQELRGRCNTFKENAETEVSFSVTDLQGLFLNGD